MNKFHPSMFLFAGIALSSFALAGEHPKGAEHPQNPPTETAPTVIPPSGEINGAPTTKDSVQGIEKKAKKKKTKKMEPTSWNSSKVQKDLLAFIQKESQKNTGGVLTVNDTVTQSERKLTLNKIHTDKIVRLQDGTSFVCADFLDHSGDKVDVDFFMKPTSTGSVASVDRIELHKINGTERFTYVQKDNVWVQQAVN